jgi:methylenetetrahydrofolate dehydrogenase (NADP+)/methenyltetrahydrofolate cyclohydrolase
MPVIIDGKSVSQQIKSEIKAEIERDKLSPGLAVVIAGNDPASRIYVRNKKKSCEECGIISREIALDENIPQNELLQLIDNLNTDKSVNGILVQQPLPPQLNVTEVNERISPLKDVDAFRAENAGRVMSGKYSFLPCTPAGIMELLRRHNISVCGKDCVVIGRSDIVGKPMAMLLMHENGTVTVCHSKTRRLAEICRRADILVSAAGKARLVTADMVKPGAVVVDVGMNRDEQGKICGDVCFEEVYEKSGYITPVPGGVGPMTIAMLMKNTVTAYRLQNKERYP